MRIQAPLKKSNKKMNNYYNVRRSIIFFKSSFYLETNSTANVVDHLFYVSQSSMSLVFEKSEIF